MKYRSILMILLSATIIFTACKKEDEETPAATANNGSGSGSGGSSNLNFLPTGDDISVAGNLITGADMPDLSWAWNSSMACFVEPGDHHFTGNHVLYQKDLPTNSIATITLVPDDPASRMALYAYTKGAGNTDVPPSIYSCVSCEADPSNNNGTLTGNRSIELVAITNPYSMIIGVAGGDESTSGGYTLNVSIDN